LFDPNIFVLSHEPKDCARLLCDEHVKSCAVTYTQLLVNQHNVGKIPDVRPKKTDTGVYTSPQKIDHPCNKWVAEGEANYLWLWEVLKEVWAEHQHRFGIKHPSELVFKDELHTPPIGEHPISRTTHMTTPPVMLPEKWIRESNPNPNQISDKLFACIDAYKGYYKFVRGTWTKRPEPKFMTFLSNRCVEPRDAHYASEDNASFMDIEAKYWDDEDFRTRKAIIDAKFPPRKNVGKTFKRMY